MACDRDVLDDLDVAVVVEMGLIVKRDEEHLVAASGYFDKDGSDNITVDELQQACVEHNMTDVLLEDISKEVDQDNVEIAATVTEKVELLWV
ncbi:calcium-dependent protein kinase 6-like isoform X2 [Papaver somniferum]|uniref:calcium-dependent protein kinase 6-like isoform X2 n=1 Tax=Papaver somniferum TaxID=3469 RepID=UPI000E6FDCF8|nr:calcium-dependent protein kinase 6-like isoform X2 [Papaver somniferum]